MASMKDLINTIKTNIEFFEEDIKHLKENGFDVLTIEKQKNIDKMKKCLDILEEEPEPKLKKQFYTFGGGKFIEQLQYLYKIYTYENIKQMEQHKIKMLKDNFMCFDGEITEDEQEIKTPMTLTFSKTEKRK